MRITSSLSLIAFLQKSARAPPVILVMSHRADYFQLAILAALISRLWTDPIPAFSSGLKIDGTNPSSAPKPLWDAASAVFPPAPTSSSLLRGASGVPCFARRFRPRSGTTGQPRSLTVAVPIRPPPDPLCPPLPRWEAFGPHPRPLSREERGEFIWGCCPGGALRSRPELANPRLLSLTPSGSVDFRELKFAAR